MIMKLLPIRKKAYIEVDGKRIDAYQSSSYMCITGKLAKFICEELCNNKKIMDYFRYAFVPEELVIPTIVFNSQFRAHCTVYPRKRYEGLKNLSSITYFNYGKSIQVFNLENYDELMSSNKMFARKFATGISDTLMDRLDKEHNLIK